MNIKAELAAMERMIRDQLAERYRELAGEAVRTRHRAVPDPQDRLVATGRR